MHQKTTKDRIFEIAVDLFSRKGFSGVSIREITRSTGIKESSLYNHYTNKEKLLDEIFDYYCGEIRKMIPTDEAIKNMVIEYSPEDLLMKMLMTSKFYANNPLMDKISRIITIEQYRNTRARDICLYEKFSIPRESMEKLFKKMMDEDIILQADAYILSKEYLYAIQALVDKYNLLISFDMDTDEVEEDMKKHIDFILKTVRKQGVS